MSEEINIPKHWQVKRLVEVCKLKNGYAFKSDNYESEGIPVIRISDINGGIVSSNKAVRVKADEEYENYLVENNDILVAMSGATTGKFGIYKSTEKAYQNQRVGKFKILDEGKLDNQFLFHQINSLKRQIEKDAYGGAQPNISSTKIEQMQIALPPFPEQQRIVEKIEELFSSLDKGIESLKTAQQQLKVYRQAVLKWAFEGKLTNVNVVEGELPDEWRWVKLEEVVDEFIRGPFGGSLKKECFVPNGYKVYEQKNAIYQSTALGKYFINENKFQELIRFKVKPADFIISCSGTIGKLFMIPEKAPKGIINQALLIIRINRDLLIDKFFMYLFTSSFFQRLIINDAKGTAMLNLAGVKDMKLVPVLLPPIREQKAIVAEIESRLSVCDKIEESIEQSLKQSESLRQSILKKAFEGKLVPQDPKDEPASKLLARIRAEKESLKKKK